MLRRLLLLLFFPISLSLQGQCMTVPESLDNLISASSLVVEGKVRSQQSYWDTENKNIYTLNTIEIFKSFKGIAIPLSDSTPNTINVVTKGGAVGLEMDRVSNALELEIGEMGIFLLEGFPGSLALTESLPLTETLYRPTEGVLGYIQYDLVIGTAKGVFDSYSDISNELYALVTSITGLSIIDIALWDTDDAGLNGQASVERSIVSEDTGSSNTHFEVHAGVGDLLTLTGADFGEQQGNVLFPDANSGGTRYISTLVHQIRSWSANEIVLEVPYRAGTGRIRIDKADGESLIGDDVLPIGYDHINVQYTDNNGRKAYETQLTSDNGKGGYDFRFESDFAANTGAAKAFTSLIETWACTTGVNFQIGEVTEVDEDANDGINIVRFDNGDELGGRTLAYARSRYRGCYQGDTIKWFVNEIEVVVNDDYNWYYGDGTPDRSQFDFETVMLHEIGHTQQLGHVINSNEVMHFAVGPGQQKRVLSNIDTIGGIFVTDKSTGEAVCGRTLMERYDDCCETLGVVSHPSDSVLCPGQESATFEFEVDFAEAWQWQKKMGEIWLHLSDDEIFASTDSPVLTVQNPNKETTEFRCIATNTCGESAISESASLQVRAMEFSMTSQPASCTTDGLIILDRTATEGSFKVSIDGSATFETTWAKGEAQKSLKVAPNSYEVFVMDTETGCSVALGTLVIQESIALELSARVLKDTECTGVGGQLQIDFNDRPDYTKVFLSIDGGITFEAFDDILGTAVFNTVEEGNHQVLGMWEDGTCPTSANAVFVGSMTCPDGGSDNGEEPETDNPKSDAGDDDSDLEESKDPSINEDQNDFTLKVFPNPATERIYVQIAKGDILRFQLFNIRGILVQDAVAKKDSDGVFYMDITNLQVGVYTLFIREEGKNTSRQVIIK